MAYIVLIFALILPRTNQQITVKAPHKLVCMKNTALGGVLRQIQYSGLPHAVFFSQHTPSYIQTRGDALTNTYK